MKGLCRFWQIVSVDTPWVISNWLWAALINPLLAGLRQVTLRGIMRGVLFVLILWAVAQVFPPDVAVMFAGDTALYIDLASFACLVIARSQAQHAARPAIQMLRAAMRGGGQGLIRAMARARRMPRLPRLFDKADSDDVADGAIA